MLPAAWLKAIVQAPAAPHTAPLWVFFSLYFKGDAQELYKLFSLSWEFGVYIEGGAQLGELLFEAHGQVLI